MAEFKPGVPVVSAGPTVTVDNPLPVGPVTFKLTVVDDSGNESEAAILKVTIADLDKPTAVLEVFDAKNNLISAPAGQALAVPAGQVFTLSAAKSIDKAPGKIKEYRFTLVGP